MAVKKNELSWDFVYMPDGTQEGEFYNALESVEVLLKVGANSFTLEISSEKHVAKIDLEAILKSISRTILKKMRVNILTDCDVFYIEADKKYKIVFEDSGTIKSLDEI